MAEPFLDTNIFLRHLTGQPPEQAARATAYFQRIEQGNVRVVTVDMVIFEVVYTLQKSYRLSKKEVQAILLPLIDLPGIALAYKKYMHEVFDWYVTRNLPFADAYYLVTMKAKHLNTILPTVMICVSWYTPLACISVLVLEEYADDPDRVYCGGYRAVAL